VSNKERSGATTDRDVPRRRARGAHWARGTRWPAEPRTLEDLVRNRAADLQPGGQPYAWAAASFYLLGSGLLVVALVRLHLDGATDQPVLTALAGICAGAGLMLVLGRSVAGRWVRRGAVLLGLAVVTTAASSADNLAGLLLCSFGYLWAAVYIAYFFERQAVYALTALTTVCVVISLVVAGLPDPGLAGVVIVVTVGAAVIVLRRLVELLEERANTDPLTGLLNRNGLEVATQRILAARDGGTNPLSLAVLDLDDFSKVNNRLGHFAADELLLELAEHWHRQLGPDDVVARLGGDEFLLVLPGANAAAAVRKITDLQSGAPLQWSSGVVELGPEGLDHAVAAADRLLLEAKRRKHGES
jgi:diguanylate cyclase (GGDEF)-like protein